MAGQIGKSIIYPPPYTTPGIRSEFHAGSKLLYTPTARAGIRYVALYIDPTGRGFAKPGAPILDRAKRLRYNKTGKLKAEKTTYKRGLSQFWATLYQYRVVFALMSSAVALTR